MNESTSNLQPPTPKHALSIGFELFGSWRLGVGSSHYCVSTLSKGHFTMRRPVGALGAVEPACVTVKVCPAIVMVPTR